jgi:acetyltransferase-like isoleucine patch superfamily enzyme
MPTLSDPHRYSPDELRGMLAAVGDNVNIHRSVLMFSPHLIHVGSNVRIDCFSLLSAGQDGIYIGDHVHIAAGVYLFGAGGRIVLESFCGLSSRVAVYTASDDYTEGYLTNPTVPVKFRKVHRGDVVLRRHAIVGAGSILLPAVTLGLGASVGALTLVNKPVGDFAVVAGFPFKVLGERNKRILEGEKQLLEEEKAEKGSDEASR